MKSKLKISAEDLRALELQNAAHLARIKQMRVELASQFREKLVTFMSTALGVVAALFWQTAILDTIKAFIPVGGTWIYELLMATLVTILAVMALSIMHQQTAPPLPEPKTPASGAHP